MTITINPDDIITIRNVMEMLGIGSINRAHFLMRRGAFRPFRKAGQTLLFNRNDVVRDYESFISMQEAKAG